MNSILLALLGVAALNLSVAGQTVTVTDADQDSRTLEIVDTRVNAAGLTEVVTNRVVEVASSMHYWDGVEWQPSSPDFELVNNSVAAATRAPHQVSIQANLNAVGAVTLVLADGTRLVTSPGFLAFRCPRTHQSALVGEIHDCAGQLISPTQVLFTNAMSGVQCSMLYENRIDGMEQNLILEEPLNPLDFGVPDDPDTRLELWTEVYEAPPATLRATTSGEISDLYVDFGAAQIGIGKSFLLEGDSLSVPVGKGYGPVPDLNSTFLVETVTYGSVKPLMDTLGQQAGVNKRTRVQRLAGVRAPGDKALFASVKRKPLSAGKHVAFRRGPLHLGPGLVLDYSTVNGSKTSFTFSSGGTYFINGNTTFASGSLVTFEGGSVLKYSAGVKLTLNCPLSWGGASYRPVILTAQDDHSVGEMIGTNALSGYYASPALEINASTAGADALIHNFQIRHATVGITINGRTGHRIDHGQFQNCGSGVSLSGTATTLLRNVLFANTLTNLSGSGCTVSAEHVTAETGTYFNKDLANCSLANSILAGITTTGTLSSVCVQTYATTNGVFQTALSGRHYLANDSYRNTGSASVSILSEITNKTTYPPMVLTGSITVDTTLVPVVSRDTVNPDCGFHYDPLDVIAQEVTLYRPVTLSGGVAVGVAGVYGFSLQGAGIYSTGLPNQMNRLVKYNLVQESTNIWDGKSASVELLLMTSSAGTRPDIALQFTEVVWPPDGSARSAFLYAGTSYTTYTPNQIYLKDCQFLNSTMILRPDVYGMPLTLSNCLFQQLGWTLGDGSSGSQPMNVTLQNCTLLNSSLNLSHSTNGSSWSFYDTLFASTGVSSGGTVALQSGRNGYFSSSVLAGSSGGDIVITNLDYQTGPLGKYYYNTNQAGTNTSFLINKDATASPANAGLYHYTTQVGQGKDSATTPGLDIGFHYVATSGSASTLLNDADSDGIPDYLEDSNGNGVTNSGETDWKSATDVGLWIKITEPKGSSNIP